MDQRQKYVGGCQHVVVPPLADDHAIWATTLHSWVEVSPAYVWEQADEVGSLGDAASWLARRTETSDSCCTQRSSQ